MILGWTKSTRDDFVIGCGATHFGQLDISSHRHIAATDAGFLLIGVVTGETGKDC